MRRAFQSPYGGRGRLDGYITGITKDRIKVSFQSPYGGGGRSDMVATPSLQHLLIVSITLRWRG